MNLRNNKIVSSVQTSNLNGAFVVYFDLALVATLALGFTVFLVATLALGFAVPLTTVLVAVLLVEACAAGIPAVPTIPDNSAPRARAVATIDLRNLKFMVDDSG